MAANEFAEKNKSKPTMDLKRQAVEYYNKNNVPKCLEELLNTMFLDNPKDIYGYMAEYFVKRSNLPTIAKIEIKDTLSSRGYNSFTSSVYCEINGLEKLVLCSSSFFDDGPKKEIPKVKSKPPTGSKSKSDKKSVAAQLSTAVNQSEAFLPKARAIQYDVTVSDVMLASGSLVGQPSLKQAEMDKLIKIYCEEISQKRVEQEQVAEATDAELPPEKHTDLSCPDCLQKTKVNYAELHLSLMTAQLSYVLNGTSLFESLYTGFNSRELDEIQLPTPMILMMKSGTDSIGKLNLFRGVYLAPKPQQGLLEGFQKIASLYRELGNVLQQKLGANGRLVNTDGSYSPPLDRPDQVFEYLQNAASASNNEIGIDFDLVLDIGASYFYEQEKKKYEISTGNFRTTEDMLLMYADFLEKYPVIGIIDGLSHKDPEGCRLLNKQLSEQCYCFGDTIFMETVDLIGDHIESQACNGAVIRLGNYFSNLTELEQISRSIKDKNCGYIMMSTTAQGCFDSLSPDLAIAFGATFIGIGSPLHNENIDTCNRLIQVESELKTKAKYKPRESYSFPEYKDKSEEPGEQHETNSDQEKKL